MNFSPFGMREGGDGEMVWATIALNQYNYTDILLLKKQK